MTTTTNPQQERGHPLWLFSLQAYQYPQVATACTRLQTHYQANINILLFCCWLAFTRRGQLSVEELRQCQAALSSWHQHITSPLRQLRRRVASTKQGWAQTLKRSLLDDELFAEYSEQVLLAQSFARDPDIARSQTTRVTDAIASLQAYGELLNAPWQDTEMQTLTKIVLGVFPNLSPSEFLQITTQPAEAISAA
jgi:uncharacterized protein (TIGR02444 family)